MSLHQKSDDLQKENSLSSLSGFEELESRWTKGLLESVLTEGKESECPQIFICESFLFHVLLWGIWDPLISGLRAEGAYAYRPFLWLSILPTTTR